MAARILNYGVPEGQPIPYCAWCDGSGWLYLHRYTMRKAQNGTKYREQVVAGCGFCQLGHEHHRRYGGPWDYPMTDVDVTIAEDIVQRMGADDQALYARIRAAGEAIAKRSIEMQLPKPRIPKLDGAFYAEVDPEYAHLDPGPGPATMDEHRPEGQTPSPDTEKRGARP